MGHWIRTNGYVRVPVPAGGDLAGGLIALGITAGIVIFFVILIKVLDR